MATPESRATTLAKLTEAEPMSQLLPSTRSRHRTRLAAGLLCLVVLPGVAVAVASPAAAVDDEGIKNQSYAQLADPNRNIEIGGFDCNFYTNALSEGADCGGGYSSEAWCADFVEWVWGVQGVNVEGITPAAQSLYDYGVAHGTYHEEWTQVGDAVTLWSGGEVYHTGIVTDVYGDGTFGYISGNTSRDTPGVSDSVGHHVLTIDPSWIGFSSPT